MVSLVQVIIFSSPVSAWGWRPAAGRTTDSKVGREPRDEFTLDFNCQAVTAETICLH